MPSSGGASGGGALELVRVVHLHQDVHPEVLGEPCELVERRVPEGGDNQKDAIRAERPRLVDLVGVDDEVLAQHRQPARRPRLHQMAVGAAEERLVGEHRKRRRTSLGVVARNRLRIEVLAQHPLARRRLLQLRDDRRLAGRDARLQRRGESARRGLRPGPLAQNPQRSALRAIGNFTRLVADDAAEHVRAVPEAVGCGRRRGRAGLRVTTHC